jgi:hypothetical protein
MMKAIFETKKSPFYHFGHLMRLEKIPYNDFHEYLTKRFYSTAEMTSLSSEILQFTACHPYYTQQLAYYCWAFLENNEYESSVLNKVIINIIRIHDTDYERLWNTISKTDKKVLIALANNEPFGKLQLATSTVYSGIKRLIERGYLIKSDTFKFDDPFFKRWIENRRNIDLIA